MRSLIKIIHVISIITLFGACKDTELKESDKVYLCPTEDLIKIDTRKTKPSTSCLRYFKDDNNAEWLIYMVREFNEINIFSLADGTLFNKYKFDSRGPQGIGHLTGFYVHNMDSIYLSSNVHYNTLFTINDQGIVANKIKLKMDKCPEGIYAVKPLSTLGNTEAFINKDIFAIICNYNQGRDNTLMHQRTLANTYTSDGKISKVVKYPKYNYLKGADYYHFSALFDSRKRLALSFNQSEEIFLYNFLNDQYTTKKVKSKYQKGDLAGRTLNRNESILQSMARYVNNPSYEHFLYDKYRKLYYRFFYPGVELKESDDVKALWESPSKFSVMILDEELNVMGETLMPEKQYDYKMSFVTQDGLYIALHFENKKYDPDWLTFQKFEIKDVIK
jgi:hypothetical protein